MEPGVELVPAEQLVQVDELVAPVILEKVPAEQLVQVDELVAPVILEKVPAEHKVQGSIPVPKLE